MGWRVAGVPEEGRGAGVTTIALFLGYGVLIGAALLAAICLLIWIADGLCKLIGVLGYYRQMQSWAWNRRRITALQENHMEDLRSLRATMAKAEGSRSRALDMLDRQIHELRLTMPQKKGKQ